MAATPVQKSEEEWRAVLSPEQFRILRQKGTEERFTGEYNKLYDEGVYNCTGCQTPLYKSTTKFDSGCGWPAFFEGLPGAINRSPDAENESWTEITFSPISTCFIHVASCGIEFKQILLSINGLNSVYRNKVNLSFASYYIMRLFLMYIVNGKGGRRGGGWW